MRNCSLALAMLLLAAPAFAEDKTLLISPLGTEDYSEIRAAVVSVRLLDFPEARLDLQVTESSNTRVFDPKKRPSTIEVRNYLWRSLGRVDCLDNRNIGSLAAYYLLQGDEIRAKLFSGPGSQWYIYGIKRVGRALEERAASSVKMVGDLKLILETEKDTYRFGEAVPLTLSVTNTGDETQTLTFSSGQRYDFVVSRSGGEVWRWSTGKFFTMALGSLKLAPGETLTFRETWRQEDNKGRRAGRGSYEISAILTTMGAPRPKVGPATIVIEPSQGPGIVSD